MPKNVVQFTSQGNEVKAEHSTVEPVPAIAAEKFVYLTPAFKKLLEALVRSVDDKAILTIVQGEPGSGKTVLLQQFLHQARPEWDLCLIQASYVIGEKHILEQLNSRFFPRQQYDIETLAGHLVSAADKRSPVILVDDAHNLSSFALDVLLSLKFSVEEQGGRLGLILFALPSIQDVLSSPSLHRHDETIRVIDMPGLTKEQTLDFIDQQLAADGSTLQQDLSAAQKQGIVRRSQGRPGCIYTLLMQAVNNNDREPAYLPRLLQQALAQPRLWAGAAVLLLLTYGLFGLMTPSPERVPDLSMTEPGQTVTERQSQEKNATSPEVAKADRNKPVIKKAEPAVANVPARHEQSGTPEQMTVAVAAKPLQTAAASPDRQTAAAPDTRTVEDSDSPPVRREASAAENATVNGQDWLQQQNTGDYTIQLAASANEEAIKRFIRAQPLVDGLRFVHLIRRGKDGYVSLYGSYPTFSKAKQAIAELPESMRNNGPWIRQIADLQALMPVTVTPVPAEQPTGPDTDTSGSSESQVPAIPASGPEAAVDAVVSDTASDNRSPENGSAVLPVDSATTAGQSE